jgi:hypothetical protein
VVSRVSFLPPFGALSKLLKTEGFKGISKESMQEQ